LLALLALAALFVLGYLSQSGAAGGLADGRLAPCPGTPNCVCSEYAADADHHIEPIAYTQADAAQAMELLKTAIRDMGGVVRDERGDYLAATFTSSIFRFVDDLEIRVDAAHGRIHLRSASRVGRGDLGANRKRAERLSKLFAEKSG